MNSTTTNYKQKYYVSKYSMIDSSISGDYLNVLEKYNIVPKENIMYEQLKKEFCGFQKLSNVIKKHNVVLTGSLLTKLFYDLKFANGDIDFFCNTEQALSEMNKLFSLSKNKNKSETYDLDINHFMTVYNSDHPTPIQVIHRNSTKNLFLMIDDSFDLTCNKIFYDGEFIYSHKFNDPSEKVSMCNTSVRHSVDRNNKYIDRGFEIYNVNGEGFGKRW